MFAGKVLDGNQEASTLLAQVVHSDVTLEMTSDLKQIDTEVNVQDVGIWIDPIGMIVNKMILFQERK